MDDQLLVRTYNVGLGDCIYVRVPDRGEYRHVLIDCGNTHGNKVLLGRAIEHLAGALGEEKALDLLVVTHPHSDHITGFGAHKEKFLALTIRQLWLTAAMDPKHPQAEQARKLQAFSEEVLRGFRQLSLGPGVDQLVRELLALNNQPSLDLLRQELPAKDGNTGPMPQYVHDQFEPQQAVFQDPETQLHILGPRRDIDGEYLGRIGEALALFQAHDQKFRPRDGSLAANWGRQDPQPANLSRRDFRRLRERLFKNALAFVLSSNELVNNTSVILLLEWGGRRLLFTGDAQFRASRDGKYERGKPNGAWNVLWHHHRDRLSQPVDFLKVGHHGSENATPWVPPEPGQPEHRINDILNALVPPDRRQTEIVISTERTRKYPSIPDRRLVTELGQRAATRHHYDEPAHMEGRMTGANWAKYDPDEELLPKDVPQPARTDLEHQRTGQEVGFIDRRFARVAAG